MFPPHSCAALLSLFLLGGALALAQDDPKEAVSPDTLDKIVDDRAEDEREKREARPEGADPGESSYNVSDCEAAWKGERSSPGEASEGETDALEECENVEP